MKKVLLIIVLYALFPTWGMSESLKIDVYIMKRNMLEYIYSLTFQPENAF